MTFNPNYAVPPGATVKESIAAELGLSEENFDKLLAGEYPITDQLAIRLQLTTGISAKFWLRLEENYRQKLKELEHEPS